MPLSLDAFDCADPFLRESLSKLEADSDSDWEVLPLKMEDTLWSDPEMPPWETSTRDELGLLIWGSTEIWFFLLDAGSPVPDSATGPEPGLEKSPVLCSEKKFW